MNDQAAAQDAPNAVQRARTYYDSQDADQFYQQVWGGEDIHIGLYQSDQESIAEASRRSVETMAGRFRVSPTPQDHLIDLGAGYGGAARYLVDRFGCQVTALNLSETENQRHRQLNDQAGVADRIRVVEGDFENIPAADGSLDYVWSQDAFLHSGDRDRVIAEIARVLRGGGELVFSDPMAANDCPPGVLEPILQRIHLSTLGSPQFYEQACRKHGLLVATPFEDRTDQLVQHYTRVLRETEARQAELAGEVSADYIERMKRGLQHWIDGGNHAHLAWGFFHFIKPTS